MQRARLIYGHHRMRVLFLLVLITMIATSCCKVGCIKESINLMFIGYGFRELDSTLIRKYEPNTGFTVLIDSIYRNSAVSDNDSVPMFLNENIDNIDVAKDYTITVKTDNKTFRLSNIVTSRFSCPCENRKGKAVSGYVVNGVGYESGFVYLNRN